MKKIAVAIATLVMFWGTSFAQTNKSSFFLNKDEQKEINTAVKNLTSSCQTNVFSQVYDDYLTIAKTASGDVVNLKVTGNDFTLEIVTSDEGIQKILLTSIEDERTQAVTLVQGNPVLSDGYIAQDGIYSFTIGMLKSINLTVEDYFTNGKAVATK